MDETKSQWGISDAFWNLIEPMIPAKKRNSEKVYQRKAGSGRPPLPYRKVFGGIIYVLRTGSRWKDLPQYLYGNPTSVNMYFNEWLRAGFFQKIWKAGLAEHVEMAGVPWCWNLETNAPITDSELMSNKKRRRQWRPAIVLRKRG